MRAARCASQRSDGALAAVRVVHREHQSVAGREFLATSGTSRAWWCSGMSSATGPALVQSNTRAASPACAGEQLLLADRVEQLADDAVGEALLQREPAGGEDPQVPLARRPQQRGLADPRGSFHQHQGAVARGGGRDGGGQRRQFLVALEHDRVFHPPSA